MVSLLLPILEVQSSSLAYIFFFYAQNTIRLLDQISLRHHAPRSTDPTDPSDLHPFGPAQSASRVACRSPAPSPVAAGFGWPKTFTSSQATPTHPISLVQVTLNSLCSTHKHKDNSFCFALYMVRSLFVLSMWDISQFYLSLFLCKLPTHIT